MFYNELLQFKNKLTNEEKSIHTIKKYERDVHRFIQYLESKHAISTPSDISRDLCILYKKELIQNYKYTSVNSMLVSMNQFLLMLNRNDCKVKLIKIQKQIFLPQDQVLSMDEYKKLVLCARMYGRERIALIMETLASTGIRVSELDYIDVESIHKGYSQTHNKGKARQIFIPYELKYKLLYYTKQKGITEGPVFITNSNKNMNRSNIWKEMKNIAIYAGIVPSKVYPHSFRHLFASTYYQQYKDIVKLADLLGHSSIQTTRIYTITSGKEHEEQINQLGLVV